MAQIDTPTPPRSGQLETRRCSHCDLELHRTVVDCPRCGARLAESFGTGIRLAEKYELLETIGSGGMGVIYKARNELLNKSVAIKTLHAHLCSPELLQRFQREAKAAGNLRHPHIISVHDLGLTEQGNPYMVMELCEGRTLGQMLKEDGPLNVEIFAKIFIQVCDALSHAHSRGVLHRDIKPSNIMLMSNNANVDVRILDFGIAKLKEMDLRRSQHLTRTGEAIGSPLYMSPEQASGGAVDERSDLYSLGCVMYEALCGLTPHEGANILQTMMKHMNEPPLSFKEISLGSIDVGTPIEALVMRLLAKSPDDRYQSMEEVKCELIAIHQNYRQENISSQSSSAPLRKPIPKFVTAVNPIFIALTCVSLMSVIELGFIVFNWSKIFASSSPKVEQSTNLTVEEHGQITPEEVESAVHQKNASSAKAALGNDDRHPMIVAFKESISDARTAPDTRTRQQFYEQALSYWKKIPQVTLSVAEDGCAMAVYFRKQQPSVSISIYQRLLELYRTLPSPDSVKGQSMLLLVMGECYRDIHQISKAENCYETALHGNEQIASSDGTAVCRIALGELAIDKHNYVEAEQLLRQALRELEHSKNAGASQFRGLARKLLETCQQARAPK